MRLKKAIIPILTLTLISLSNTASSQNHQRYSCQVGSVAFDGYDLVSYFQGGPVLGKKDISMEYDGIILQFSSRENLATFKKNPGKYLPAYGGWCATAITHSSFVVPNYTMYKIQDEKLLFFEVRGFFNGRSQWDKDPLKHEFLADRSYRESVTKTEDD